MKILTQLDGTSMYLLVTIKDKETCGKIGRLVGKGRHKQAIKKLLEKGKVEGRYSSREEAREGVDLILTGKSAHWDMLV
ncbi:MAG: hypothetical protein WBD24_00140 [Candidatus Omnitrophota bacterium]